LSQTLLSECFFLLLASLTRFLALRTTRLQGDLIILGQPPQLSDLELPAVPKPFTEALPRETIAARYAFSHALARSTALSALESSLENYLSSVSRLPYSLSRTGKPDLTRKEIIMKLGQLLKLRQKLNLSRESFDETPDLYWAEPALESEPVGPLLLSIINPFLFASRLLQLGG
jgi:required for meiotic nuclear division protein 1